MTTIIDASHESRRRIAGFVFGLLLPVLPAIAGYILNPSGVAELTGGRIQLLIIGIAVGFALGHYLGLAVDAEHDVTMYAAIGALLTVSVTYAALSFVGEGFGGTVRAMALLVVSMSLLILGHYSGVLAERDPVEEMVDYFVKRGTPTLLTFVWTLEVVSQPLLDFLSPLFGLGSPSTEIVILVTMLLTLGAVSAVAYLYYIGTLGEVLGEGTM